MFFPDMRTMMNVSHDWVIVLTSPATKDNTRLSCSAVGTRLRKSLQTFFVVFLCFVFFLTLQFFFPLVFLPVVSAFHEHNPPGLELTQLSSPRGKNTYSPVSVCVCERDREQERERYLCLYSMISLRI